jgi:DNA-binding NtrC family response regulator
MAGQGLAGARVLVADDQTEVLESLRLLLKPEGCQVEAATSPAAVLGVAAARELDVVLVDLNYTRDTTSGAEGLELLAHLQALDPTLPVVVMTAWGSVELAVEAVRRGARDFVQKPWDNERLVAIVRTQVALGRALRRGRLLEAENRVLRAEAAGVTLIATSSTMKPVLDLIQRVGPSDANVLVTGEHGTGKDVVARALHAVSPRAERPLVAVNLGGLAEGVFASELFGHVRGAFTDARVDRVGRFETADGGTLFLDEVANLPLPQQATLLRVLETGEVEPVGSSRARRVDVRLISATNSDLAAEAAAGRFRADLLFRLNTVEIRLPPLRERLDDIPVLGTHFLGRFAQRYRKGVTGFDSAALEALRAHPWPGNVRELAHVVERAVLLAADPVIHSADLGLERPGGDTTRDLEAMTLEEVERALVDKALKRSGGNVSRAAASLGLSRSAFYRRLEKHGL